VITGEIKRTGCYKSDTQESKTFPWFRCKQDSRNGIRKELSALAEIKRDEIKAQNMKRIRLLRKYNTEKKENLDQMIEDLKQQVSAKT
jgi:hypothetical protein